MWYQYSCEQLLRALSAVHDVPISYVEMIGVFRDHLQICLFAHCFDSSTQRTCAVEMRRHERGRWIHCEGFAATACADGYTT